MQTSYRRASADDAALLAATGAAVWISTYALEGVSSDMAAYVLAEFTGERLRTRLEHPHTVVWVAESSDGVIGFAELKMTERTPALPDPSQAEVARLYVLERFSRQGIGRRLLQRCTQHAFERDATVVWLSVWSGNARALEFYRALGWSHVGGTTFVLGGVAHPNHVFAMRRPM